MRVTRGIPRYLITTADERTWVADQPVLFLGEWCRLYNRMLVWENLDAKVVHYHWDDRKKLYKDYQYLQGLFEGILVELSTKLNEIHKVNHSVRYWRIFIGPWLGYFIQILFDRWTMIERALSDYEITGVRVLDTELAKVVPNDMDHFIQLMVTDNWNEAIYGQLLCNFTELHIEKVISFVETKEAFELNSKWASFRQRIKKVLSHIVSISNKLFVRSDEAFFISSYLPVKKDFCLQIRVGQFPKYWYSIPAEQTNLQMSARNWILGNSHERGFEHIVRVMIPKHLPTLYVEGYPNLQNQIHNLPWPKRPRLIFTSNSYSSDDVFKAWAATKAEESTPFIIGQHGGNFGTSQWSFTEDHQIRISDAWISWGWNDINNLKIKQFGNLKLINNKHRWDQTGYALLVETTIPRYSYHMYSIPVASQFLDYFEDQLRFTTALSEKVKSQLLVRLYNQDYGWSQKHRWQDRFPDVRLDDGTTSISKLIKHSRLYISTYNATTFLESLSLNVPTIIFWNPEHWELRDDAVPYFNRLREVGIFHESPESAAAKVNGIWDDVQSWWSQSEIQEARAYFCNRFARTVQNPVKHLQSTLLSIKA